MLFGGDLGLLCIFAATVLGLFVVRRKWRRVVVRREEIKGLMILMSEEAARAELEAASGYQRNYNYALPKVELVDEELVIGSGSSPARQIQYQCEVCFSPTKTRCKQCKVVRYCSGKCQIIHWRQGHKDKCHSMSSHQNIDASVHSFSKEFKEEGIGKSSNMSGIDVERPKLVESSSEEKVNSNPTLHVLSSKNDTKVANCGEEKGTDRKVESLVDSLPGEHSSMSVDSSNRSVRKGTSSNVESMEPLLSKQPRITNPDNGAASFIVSNQLKSGCIDLDELPEISTSSSCSDTGSEEHSLSEPSKLCSDFWKGTVEPIGTKIHAPDDLCSADVAIHLSSCYSSFSRIKAHAGVLCSDKIPEDDPRPAISIPKKVTNEVALLEVKEDELKSRGPLVSSSEPPNHMSGSKTSIECISKVEESKSSFTSACQEFVSSLQSVASKQPENEIYCINGTPNNVSLENDCPPVGTSVVHLSTTASLKNSAYVQNFKSGTTSSSMKVMDQLRKPNFIQHGSSGAGNGIRWKHEGSFPYELFVKLYCWKIELRPCGLLNCGNSCYANAVLQCLAFTPVLTAYFLQGLHSESCLEKDWCFTCEFQMLINKAKESSSPLSPARIISQVQRIGRHLSIGAEEDAHEFFRYAIDTMQSACLKEAKVKAPCTFDEETTLMGLTFGGYLRSKIECMRCGGISEQHERIMDLAVEIGGDIGTLEKALLQFTRSEILDGDNKYHCGRCKSLVKAKKKLRVLEAPNVLTIALKRFESGKFGKLNKEVKFPAILNIAPYMSGTSDTSPIYMLYAVIVHLDDMNSTYSGHYVCYVKNNHGRWFQADDSMVQVVELEEVLSKGAYMLLYARCSPRAPRLIRSSISKATSPICKPKSYPAEPCGEEKHQSDCLFQHSRSNLLHKDEDCLSEDFSYFSESGSHSTESSANMGSTTSSDDSLDRNFGDMRHNSNNNNNSPCRIFSDSSDTSSSSSSPSPLHVKQSLDHYENSGSCCPVNEGSNGFWGSSCENLGNDKGRGSYWCPESLKESGKLVGSCSSSCKGDVCSCRLGGVYLRRSLMGRADY